MQAQSFLSAASQVLENSSPSDIGLFGEVDMSYDEMYQSFYSVSEPCLFPQMVAESCGYSSTKECPQEEYWAMADELALELAVCPCDINPDDFEPSAWDMSCDKETLYIYLVNYKGEGEGYFKYEEVKSRIKGKYIGKYNYEAV